jgi:hypothetical protein
MSCPYCPSAGIKKALCYTYSIIQVSSQQPVAYLSLWDVSVRPDHKGLVVGGARIPVWISQADFDGRGRGYFTYEGSSTRPLRAEEWFPSSQPFKTYLKILHADGLDIDAMKSLKASPVQALVALVQGTQGENLRECSNEVNPFLFL